MSTYFYLIIGDPFLRTQKVQALTSEIEKKTGVAYSRQTYRLDEIPLGVVLANARTLPFLVGGQIFRIQLDGKLVSADLELLESYFLQPFPGTVLILEADTQEGIADLLKFAKAKGQVLVLAKEEARSASQSYLQQKLTRSQKTMTSSAKQKIFEMCGEAVVFLDSMVDRLIQYAGEKPVIDETMVSEFEERWGEVSVFQLTNAILARDRAKALHVFRELMGNGDADAQSLIGITHWQLRQLWQAAVLRDVGIGEAEILSRVKVSAFRKTPFLMAVSRYGTAKLEAAIEALYELDKKAKTGRIETVAGIESWLLEFVS